MKYDVIVIGAGIVGLAAAYKILNKNPALRILVLEKESNICMHQTGNNSGVIHSGIYYKPGSLKAINCRKGYDLLIKFCNDHNINYEICGKVIVAVNEQEQEYLSELKERGVENGLTGLKLLDESALKEYEPFAEGLGGLAVPQTGIINFREVAAKLAELIIENGSRIEFDQEVKNIIPSENLIEVVSTKNNFKADFVVSCAGLQSDRIAKTTNPDHTVRIIPFRGEYYKIKDDRRHMVRSLIYPVPDPSFPFLGVHFTRMITGEVEAGPNAVLSFKREGYGRFSFSLRDTWDTFTWLGFLRIAGRYWKTGLREFYRSFNKKAFVKALRKLIPEIKSADLERGGAGVRAQACDKNGKLLDDFYLIENSNIVHVCNAPSPAATSSLAIGEYIAGKILKSE